MTAIVGGVSHENDYFSVYIFTAYTHYYVFLLLCRARECLIILGHVLFFCSHMRAYVQAVNIIIKKNRSSICAIHQDAAISGTGHLMSRM